MTPATFQDVFVVVVGVVVVCSLLLSYQIEKTEERILAQTGSGFTNLTDAVNADTAELAAEQQSFTALEAAIATLTATPPNQVTDAQLQALADALTANQAARAADVTQANASIPPAPVSTDAAKAK